MNNIDQIKEKQKSHNRVILFPHNGAEHNADDQILCEKDSYKVMSWNIKKEHARKFMHVIGDYIDKKNELVKCKNIAFWGEWEQPSKYIDIQSNDDNGYPRFVHEPIVIDENKIIDYLDDCSKPIDEAFDRLCSNFYGQAKQNSDPYVFGESPYYSCCKQTGGMLDLIPGDVIVFYSSKGRGILEAYVDTVFVVKDCIKINDRSRICYKKMVNDLRNVVSSEFIYGVILPIVYGNHGSLIDTDSDSQNDIENVLYCGATYDNPLFVNGERMYSFFPCRSINNEDLKGFPRPLVYKKEKADHQVDDNDSSYYTTDKGYTYHILKNVIRETDNKISNTGISGLDEPMINGDTIEDTFKYWEKLKNYFIKNDYMLGVKTAQPKVIRSINEL